MTIEIFFMWVATPLLIAITILFVVLVKRAGSISEQHAAHAEDTALNFDYSKKELTSIGSNVQRIDTKLNDTIVPHIATVYKQIGELGVEVNARAIVDILTEAGFRSEVITADGVVFMGGEIEDCKISFLIKHDPVSANIFFQSFSHYITNPEPPILAALLEFNARVMIGTIGLKKQGDRYIVMVDHALHIPTGRVNKTALLDVVARMASVHTHLRNLSTQLSYTCTVLLIDEYIKLEVGPDHWAEIQKRLEGGKEKEAERLAAAPAPAEHSQQS